MLLLLLLLLRLVLVGKIVWAGQPQRVRRRHWHVLVVAGTHKLAGEGCRGAGGGLEYEVGVAGYWAAEGGGQRGGETGGLYCAGKHGAAEAAGGERQRQPAEAQGRGFGCGAVEEEDGAHEGDEDDASVEVHVAEGELGQLRGAGGERDGRQQLYDVAAVVHEECDLEALQRGRLAVYGGKITGQKRRDVVAARRG